MDGQCSLSFITKYINQLDTNIQNFSIPALHEEKTFVKEEEEEKDVELGEEEEQKEPVVKTPPCPDLMPFQPSRPIDTASICIGAFMTKEELQQYLKLTNKRQMRQALGDKIGKMPKGASRHIFIEFMIDVTIFCDSSEFGFEQTSAILGMYYITHKYFTDHLYVCPEDVLAFFKDFVMHHSVSFPPTHIKLFTIEECRGIVLHFCSLYLRHMPLIRLLSLPNFGFELEYELEPEPKPEKRSKGDKKKKDKGKKDKSSGKSKKSKKSK